MSDSEVYFLAVFLALVLISKKMKEVSPSITEWITTHLWTVSSIAAGIGVSLAGLGYGVYRVLDDKRLTHKFLKAVTADKKGSVFAGITDSREPIFIPLDARKMHTQVIGTTNAGKSESVIIPWAVADIRDGRGFVIVDGKADKSFLDRIYPYVKCACRTADFKMLSLQDPSQSHTFNPLLGGTPEEVAERVFNSFEFDNSYYESVQYEVFAQVLRIFDGAKLKPTFLRVYQAIKNPQALHDLAVRGKDDSLESWASGFKALSPSDREQKTSGLLSALSHFSFGDHARLFNTDKPDIDLDRAVRGGELIYFQLPVLKAAFLGKATGKLVLQCLQSAVANRHRVDAKEHRFFSVYLDDFTEYLYRGFVSLLNKSRSANVGVVFAHQALGDLKALGDEVANSITTNSNLKVIMRGNDPETAEFFAKIIGTEQAEQVTERAERGMFGRVKSGQGSLREVEEFLVHPNVIKRNMGVGEAIVVIPHNLGSKTVKLKFQMVPSLPNEKMPKPEPVKVLGLVINSEKVNEEKSKTTAIMNNNLSTKG
jgi:conjugal transfer pilus assembly protein TraD